MVTKKRTLEIELPEGITVEAFQKALKSHLKSPRKPKKEDSSKVFKYIEAGPDQEIRISRDIYKGKEFLSIRKWYSENGTEGLKPGKGVTFTYESIDELMDGLMLMKDYLDEHPQGTLEEEEEDL